MRLLLVEDHRDVIDSLVLYLRHQGFVVDVAPTIAIAQEALLTQTFDLVLLDRMLPDGDGLSLIAFAEARGRPQRFLVLSALAAVDEKIAGLDRGAADYVGKPFEPRELLARIRNALRRTLDVTPEVKRIGPLSFDVRTSAFFLDGEPLVLRRTEALVLEALMNRPGALVQREALESRVYGYDKLVTPNSLETQVSRLRKNLAARTDEVRIQAIRGVGYRLLAG